MSHRYYQVTLTVAMPDYGCGHEATPLDVLDLGDAYLLDADEIELHLSPVNFKPNKENQ